MKRFLFALSACAILSFAAGCTRETGDVSGEGDFVKATFNVSLDGGMDTKAISDGSQVNFLIFWAFDKDGLPLQDLEQFVEVRDKKATITVNKLIRGVEYNFAFWAQHRVERTEETYWVSYAPKVDDQGEYMKDDQGEYIIDDTVPCMAPLMGYEQMEEEMMNNDQYDAFYAKCHVDPLDADLSQDVTLTRPLAQINLAVDSEDLEVAASNNLDMDALISAFDITGQKHFFKVFDGTAIAFPVSVCPETLVYCYQPVPGDDITSGNKTYKRLGMLYVLADEDPENLDITFWLRTVQNGSVDVEIKKEIKNVPVRRNYRTNIVGKLFSVGGTFNVTVDPGFATPDNETQIDQPAPPTLYGVDPDNGIEHGVIDFVKTGNDNYLYAEGETVALTSAPENGYELTRLWWTPANDDTDEHEIDLKTLTFEMPGFDVNLYATFELITYTVNISGMIEHGNVLIDLDTTFSTSASFAPGATVDLKVTYDQDYQLDELYYYTEDNPQQHIAISNDARSFVMPAKNVFVSATFIPKFEYTGQGTAADPYTVADVRYYIDNDLQAGVKVYIKGKVSGNLSSQYGTNTVGNGTFFIVDNPGDSNYFEAYKAKFLDGEPWETGNPVLNEGDEVVIFGEPSLYNTTYEIKQGGYLYSLNGIRHVAFTPEIEAVDIAGTPQTTIPEDGSGLVVSFAFGTSDTGDIVYYTLDGTDPTRNSTKYTGPFQITSTCTVKAIATHAGCFDSVVASKTFTKAGDTGGSITYNFGEHTDFSTWTATYAEHTLSYNEADVIFASADKNAQTITDIPVTKGGNVSMVMKTADAKLAEVTFNCRQWGTKAQTITLHYSTDGGSSYTSTGITSTNFTISDDALPTGTNAVKITFSSTSNQVGIESVTFKLAL